MARGRGRPRKVKADAAAATALGESEVPDGGKSGVDVDLDGDETMKDMDELLDLGKDKDEHAVDPDFVDQQTDADRVIGKVTRKKRAAAKAKPAGNAKSKETSKGTPKHISHITSTRARIQRLIGHNLYKLADTVSVRNSWETSMFKVDPQNLSEPPELTPWSLPVIKTTKITKTILDSKFPLRRDPLTLQVDDNDSLSLNTGENLGKDELTIINTGSLITDIAWCPGRPADSQLFAISVSNITDTAIDRKFSLLERGSSTSALYIYQLDTVTSKVNLRNVLLHNWGNSWDLKWTPAFEGLGILSAVFNDGDIRLLNLGELEIPNVEVTEASQTYHLEEYALTTFDIMGNKIIAGTNTGHISEFIVNESDPSYVYPVHSDYIFCLRVNIPKYDEPIFFSASSDCTTALGSLDDLRSTIIKTPKSKSLAMKAEYCPQLHAFVQTDNPGDVKIIPERTFSPLPTMQHDGSTESLSCSEIHPMLLTGGADGKVKICNMARKLLNSSKAPTGSHRSLTLFQLQYGANEDLYRLVQTLEAEDVHSESKSTPDIYPPSVNISSVKWNNNRNLGNWLVAGTTSGFLILRKV